MEHAEEKGITIRVLYLFAGESRKTSVASFLKEKAKKEGFHVEIEGIDIMRREEDDLSLQSKQEELLRRIRAKEFDAVICTPPCSTGGKHERSPAIKRLCLSMGVSMGKEEVRRRVEAGQHLGDLHHQGGGDSRRGGLYFPLGGTP